MTPEDDLVLSDDADRVRTLTLNRPRQLNAFDQALCTAFTDALREAADDVSVHVVVVTGSGRAFSAGTDLVELAANGDFRGTPEDPDRFERLVDELAQFPKPLVCAVNGLAVGIGATMLGHADLVIMAADAKLRCPFTSLSLVPEAGASATFPSIMGRQGAMWVLLSSEWIEADEAKSLGLAWKVVPSRQLVDEASRYAKCLALHPLDSLVASKRLVIEGFDDAIRTARARENAAFDVQLRTPEHRAAVAAFVDRGPRTGPDAVRPR